VAAENERELNMSNLRTDPESPDDIDRAEFADCVGLVLSISGHWIGAAFWTVCFVAVGIPIAVIGGAFIGALDGVCQWLLTWWLALSSLWQYSATPPEA
jgi:hypothetical protein